MEDGSCFHPLDNMPSFSQGISYDSVLGSIHIAHLMLTESISSAVRAQQLWLCDGRTAVLNLEQGTGQPCLKAWECLACLGITNTLCQLAFHASQRKKYLVIKKGVYLTTGT